MKKLAGNVLLMAIGAFILMSGVFVGARITHTTASSLSASSISDEDTLKAKSDIIDKVIKVSDNVTNKFIASRKASELSNLDIQKLKDLSNKGITIIVVPNQDVYETIDPSRASENKRNNSVTDAVYIPSSKEIVVSVQAPKGVLTDQVATIIQ